VNRTVPALLARAVAEFGDREAVVAGGVRWTFAELGERAGAAARAFVTAHELRHLEHVVTLRGNAPEGTVSWSEFLASADPSAVLPAVGEHDLSDILFTSGTTGRPKGVVATHAQTVQVFTVWSDIVGLTTGDRYLIVNPFFHTFGYKAGIVACLITGATMVPEPVFDVPAVLERIAAESITMLPGPPTLYLSILNHPDRDAYDLSSLRLAVTGAAPVPVEMIERMRNELTFSTILTAYGLTESTGTVSMCRRGDDAETISASSGRAIPDVEVRIVDPDGDEVERGTSGEIVVRGYNVTAGYFEDPEATAKAIDADGWLHTGDVGTMDERGYIDITDRLKDMFIVGGFNAYPAEIENTLLGHPAIANCAVVGVPDERMGEVGHAYVVARDGASIDPDEVVAWSRERMANYKVPRAVHVVDDLPTNASGKVLKYELRERAN
jgi:acyl-CoA synthetase (AMP-forming)/AMP-acid ligase II